MAYQVVVTSLPSLLKHLGVPLLYPLKDKRRDVHVHSIRPFLAHTPIFGAVAAVAILARAAGRRVRRDVGIVGSVDLDGSIGAVDDVDLGLVIKSVQQGIFQLVHGGPDPITLTGSALKLAALRGFHLKHTRKFIDCLDVLWEEGPGSGPCIF